MHLRIPIVFKRGRVVYFIAKKENRAIGWRLFWKGKEDSGHPADALVSYCPFRSRGGFVSSAFCVRFAAFSRWVKIFNISENPQKKHTLVNGFSLCVNPVTRRGRNTISPGKTLSASVLSICISAF